MLYICYAFSPFLDITMSVARASIILLPQGMFVIALYPTLIHFMHSCHCLLNCYYIDLMDPLSIMSYGSYK